MNVIKRILSAFLAIAIVLSCSVTAFAVTGTGDGASTYAVSSPETVKVANKITASNKVLKASTKTQSFYIHAKVKGGAKLSYKSNKKSVTVNKSGKVTVAKKYVGTAKITIKSAETKTYKAATKTITVTVKKTVMPKPGKVKVRYSKAVYKTKIRLYWKKLTKNCDGYEIRVYKNAARTKLVKKIYCAKTTTSKTVPGLKRNTKYYFSIRGLNRSNNSTQISSYGSWNNQLNRRTLK